MPLDLLPPLLQGLIATVKITAGGILLTIILSFMAGLGKLSKIPPIRWLAIAYIEVFRGTSALVQLFWFFYVLPFFGVNLEPMLVGIVVLGLNGGAYGGEVVRGAIQSVPKGQLEAAVALNFTPMQTLWRIVIPQAVVGMIPPMGNIFIELLKHSALVSLVTINDLTFLAKQVRDDTLRTTEVFTIILVLYFLVAVAITLGMRLLDWKFSGGRETAGGRP